MTFEEFHELVPEGLHDAILKSFSHDYESATANFVANIYAGVIDKSVSDGERLREGKLIFQGVRFCVIEIPSGGPIAFTLGGESILSFEKLTPEQLPQKFQQLLSPDVTYYSIFIHRLFSHIYIAATDIQFEWTSADRK